MIRGVNLFDDNVTKLVVPVVVIPCEVIIEFNTFVSTGDDWFVNHLDTGAIVLEHFS